MSDPLEAPERARSAVAYGAMATVAPLVATAATALQWLRAASAPPGAGPSSDLGATVWALLTITFATASALVFGAVAGAVAIARWFAARDFDD